MMPKVDRTGHRYGRRVVVAEAPPRGKRPRWFVLCDCGDMGEVFGCSLATGEADSCGCAQREKARALPRATHDHARRGRNTPTYRTWASMVQRCTNPKNPAWPYYGGRGIAVCDRWRDFANFLADMGPRPEGLTLDRYPDNDGNYEPGNCRWATMSQQNANKRRQS